MTKLRRLTEHSYLIEVISEQTRKDAREYAALVMQRLNELELGLPFRPLHYTQLLDAISDDVGPEDPPLLTAVMTRMLKVGLSAIYDEVDAFPPVVRDQIATREPYTSSEEQIDEQ